MSQVPTLAAGAGGANSISSSTNNTNINNSNSLYKEKNLKPVGVIILIRHASKKIPRRIVWQRTFWLWFHKIFGNRFFPEKNEKAFRYHAGTLDVPLSKKGKEELPILQEEIKKVFSRIKEKLQSFSPSSVRILSSPLRRALVTAEAVGEAVGGGARIEKRDPLIERSWGKGNDQTVEKVCREYGEGLSNYYHSSFSKELPPGGGIPGAESLYELKERLEKNFLPELLGQFRQDGQVNFVVCHSGVIKALLRALVERGLLQRIEISDRTFNREELLKESVSNLRIPNAKPIVLLVYRENNSLTLRQLESN